MTFRKLGGAIAIAALTLSLLFAANAQAAKSPYPPDPEARNFKTSAGGWTSQADVTGLGPLCIAPLTCPTVNQSHVTTGGIEGAGDGFLRTTVSGVADVLVNVRSTWRSPDFTYLGAVGEEPTDVIFTFARRTDADALLQLANDETLLRVPRQRHGRHIDRPDRRCRSDRPAEPGRSSRRSTSTRAS